MEWVWKILEKILSSILVSFVLFIAGFSFMTGKFPPHRADLQRASRLVVGLFHSTNEYNQSVQALKGTSPSLEQMVEIQRLGLKRSELTMEFTKLLSRMPQFQDSPLFNQKLQVVRQSLTSAETTLKEIQQDLQRLSEGP